MYIDRTLPLFNMAFVQEMIEKTLSSRLEIKIFFSHFKKMANELIVGFGSYEWNTFWLGPKKNVDLEPDLVICGDLYRLK